MAVACGAAFTSARWRGELRICGFLAQIPGEAASPYALSAFEPAGRPPPPANREREQRRRATCDDPTPQQREGRAATGAPSRRADTFTLRTHGESLQAGSSRVPLRDGRQFSIDVNGADTLTASAPPDPSPLSTGAMRATAFPIPLQNVNWRGSRTLEVNGGVAAEALREIRLVTRQYQQNYVRRA